MIDGVVASYCLIQAEAAVFIIAQTLPVIRVMLQTRGPSPISGPATSVVEPMASPSGKGKAPALESTLGEHESIELVQLPTGKIVAASSDEGKAFKTAADQSLRQPEAAIAARESTHGHGETSLAGLNFEDEVHKAWADMGLSARAWSKSPPPRPESLRI